MPELLAMVASTVNSYSRLVPGFWAPTSATWGVENRTCALRVIQGGAKSQRVEYRIAAADINPYLAIAVAIGSGLWGIEHRIEPDEPMVGNAYERKLPAKRQLPRTLTEAAGLAGALEAGPGTVRRARSSNTLPPVVNGKNASSAAPSPIGNWRVTSRSSRAQRCRPSARSTGACTSSAPRPRPPRSTPRCSARALRRRRGAACRWRSGRGIMERFCAAFEARSAELAPELSWQMGRPASLRAQRSAQHRRARALHDRDRRQRARRHRRRTEARVSAASCGASPWAWCLRSPPGIFPT